MKNRKISSINIGGLFLIIIIIINSSGCLKTTQYRERVHEIIVTIPLNYTELSRIDYKTVCNTFNNFSFSCECYNNSYRQMIGITYLYAPSFSMTIFYNSSNIQSSDIENILQSDWSFSPRYPPNDMKSYEADKEYMKTHINEIIILLNLSIDWNLAQWKQITST